MPRGSVSSLMIVKLFMTGLAVPAPEMVVCPCRVMPFVMFTAEVHVNVPAGSVIVSPSCARLSCVYWTLVAVPFVCQVVAYPLLKHNSIRQRDLFNPSLTMKARPRSSRDTFDRFGVNSGILGYLLSQIAL